MKTILFTFLGIFLTTLSFSQDTTVYLKGYYVIRYSREQILFVKKNERLKKVEKPYTTLIDLAKNKYYFTLFANDLRLMTMDEIKGTLLSDKFYTNNEIYSFPNERDQYVKKLLNQNRINFDKSICFENNLNYYQIPKDKKYIYQFYWIEGWALRVKKENDYLNTNDELTNSLYWGVEPYSINKAIPAYYIYIFYEYDNISTTNPPPGFIEWK